MDGPFDLERFVAAQNEGGIYEQAVSELRRGQKSGHWMWFVFPQISGLGFSAMAQRYAISSLDEARAYLEHPVLLPRLIEVSQIVAETRNRTAEQIFGGVDAQKLRSSMTLFEKAEPEEPVFGLVLDRFFGGARDVETERRL